MSVYNKGGTSLPAVYNKNGRSLSEAYDLQGNLIFGGEEPWNPTTLNYDTNFLINSAWLTSATTARDAIKALYQSSADAVPFFIMTDGHGRYNEGNKGCHNLAESTMRYIPNIQLGDYASYYNYGANPTNHANSSAGISNYICAMGNHEFMSIDSGDVPVLSTLVDSYVPSGAVVGSSTYGYYKKLDNKYNIKWLVTQPHIPDAGNSSGFLTKMTSDQYAWLIDELSADDGYDIVLIQHEGLNGTYTKGDGTTYVVNYPAIDINSIVSARKAKTSGSYTDSYGVTHTYDFSGCTSDFLCSLHGHWHASSYMAKTVLGFPVYAGKDFTGQGDSCYGLIDRDGGKLHIYEFTRDTSNVIVLDL